MVANAPPTTSTPSRLFAGLSPRSAYFQAVRLYGDPGLFVRLNLLLLWLAAFVLFWVFNPIKALPYPSEIWTTLNQMWSRQDSGGLVYNIFVTLKLNVVGLLYSTILSLLIAYMSVLPFFQPFNRLVQWLRYIPIIGFNLVFLTLFTIGWPMKVAMLTVGMSFFLVTSMTAVIASIPRLKFELARVLGYNDVQTFYTVVVRATGPQMIDVIAQNAAIGWVMITAIETYNRTEGGIGSQIYAYSSVNNLPAVYTYLIIIGVIAVCEDWLFALLKRVLFPHTRVVERA
jgi:NitT/TauT family transport system permease protein